jgi:hypothetical protein
MDFGYGKFAQDAQSIRNSLVYLDALALSSRFADHVRISKALALVWMAASMETFWKSYLTELCVRVSAASLLRRRKNMAAAAIYYFDTLGSFGEGKKLKRWHRAVDFFDKLPGAVRPPYAIPYDGRTIRPDHLALAWEVFCLKGSPFPSPVHKQDLNAMADQRNDVAHGLIEPAVVGGSMTMGDLRARLSRLDDLAIHCVLAAESIWP